jgi:hypothetical protein
MSCFLTWLRQPTTIHALGVIAGTLGAALGQAATGNPTVDAIVGLIAYVLVHLTVNDHTVSK